MEIFNRNRGEQKQEQNGHGQSHTAAVWEKQSLSEYLMLAGFKDMVQGLPVLWGLERFLGRFPL